MPPPRCPGTAGSPFLPLSKEMFNKESGWSWEDLQPPWEWLAAASQHKTLTGVIYSTACSPERASPFKNSTNLC